MLNGFLDSVAYWFRLPWNIQWRTALVQIPRFVPLSVLHLTSPKGPQPFLVSLPSRKDNSIPIYIFVPPHPVDLGLQHERDSQHKEGTKEWHTPVVLDFHGGGFIMGSPLEQAPYAAMMARELGAIVISVSYRIGPFNQFPAAIHDAEDVLAAILDTDEVTQAGVVLRREIQRYYSMVRDSTLQGQLAHLSPHFRRMTHVILDPAHLAISGFSAGGNIALNMALSVPPCAEYFANTPSASRPVTRAPPNITPVTHTGTMSPILPPCRAPTILDDVNQPWESLLPSPTTQSNFLPLLLFYPSLDARLLPHERPMKPMPNALNPDDKKASKPRMPGLFSIMGPTYLPRKLRAHPRASPGLNHPDNIHKNAAILLVLPEKDTLAVQSDVWVDTMNQNDWNGPVRFGDGRQGDWDGHTGGTAGSDNIPSKENGGMEVWHAPGCRHGWTQFPDLVVCGHERSEREKVFARTLDFVKANWKKGLEHKRRSVWTEEVGDAFGMVHANGLVDQEGKVGGPVFGRASVSPVMNGAINGYAVKTEDGVMNGHAEKAESSEPTSVRLTT